MLGRDGLPAGQVTFMFTDIEGSTRLAQLLGGTYRQVLNEHRRVLRDALSRTGGVELFMEGDELFAAFTDAGAALRAAVLVQRGLAENRWPSSAARPSVRIGLHTGPAEPVAGEYASLEVHRAARISAAAHGGQVLCSAATARRAGEGGSLPATSRLLDLGLHRLRGFDGRERLFQLVAPGLEQQFPRPRTDETPAHNLPAPADRFVGRRSERSELARLVVGRRLVTTVGPGGIGKSRLAVETAGDLVGRYRDGVWYVDLGTVAEPGRVHPALAGMLGVRPEPGRPVLDTLVDRLIGQQVLLVLDTCDAHLEAARDLIGRVVLQARSVTVLAVSREPLGYLGETVWRVPPLRLASPPDGGPSEAVLLLAERTAQARGGRAPGVAEFADLGRIAAGLDGLPLALELAAARLRVLSVAQLASQVDDLFVDPEGDAPAGLGGADPLPGCGVDGRHRTMCASVTWSYRTLEEPAARLLRRLSVFAGPVDLAAVTWMHAGSPLGALTTLVDKSLLQADPGPAGTSYRMLAPIRAYAARRLSEAHEMAVARGRHVEWCLRVARAASGAGVHRSQIGSLNALDPVADEMRAALEWMATAEGARRGLALVGALDPWWRERGLAHEGRSWLLRLYERIDATGEPVPDAELATVYHVHAVLAGADGDHAEGLVFSARAERLVQRAARSASPAGHGCGGDPVRALSIRIRSGRALALLGAGRVEEAERACRAVIASAQGGGSACAEVLSAVYALAGLLWRRGALDEASDLVAAARPVEAASPGDRGHRTVDMVLGLVALARGDVVAAHEHLVVALRSRVRHGFHARACATLSAMAVRAGLGGDPVTAARLFGASQAARGRLRQVTDGYDPFWVDHRVRVRAALGDAAFDAAYADGGALSLDEAVALALAVEHPDLVFGGSGRF